MTETAQSRTSLWANGPFRKLWAAQTISELGDRITELALPLIAILTLDASAAQVGVLTAMVWLPNLASMFIGSWVDHRPRKRTIMVVADVIRAIVVLTIPIAWLADALQLWMLYAVALLAGLAHVAFTTAYPSFFVCLVAPTQYIDANSKLSFTRSMSYVAGPAVGGGLVQWLTAPYAMVVDALSFLTSAVFLRRIKTEEPRPEIEEGVNLWRRAMEGMRYVMRHPYVRPSLLASTVVNFFTLMSSAIIILFASRTLGLSPGAIGLAFGIGSLGGLLGAALAPRIARRIGLGPSAMVGSILFPLPIAIIAFADGPTWAEIAVIAGAEFLSAFGVMLYDINLMSIDTAVTADDIRSRVAGAFTTVNYGIRPLGAVVGGVLGSILGLRQTLLIAAFGGCLSLLPLLFSPIPKVLNLDGMKQVALRPDEVTSE